MSDIIDRAISFATIAHGSQVRKYTGDPYIKHPLAVATLVRESRRHTTEMVCAAILHDTVEDTLAKHSDIEMHFGKEVRDLVFWLTDVSELTDGNRAKRKEIDRLHIGNAPPEAQTIKLADLIDNSYSIIQHDPGFAKVYIREMRLLLNHLVSGDLRLYCKAVAIVDDYVSKNKGVFDV
jgi:(p)ppGpp synthase/HD superfamily hydrolase